MAIRATLADRPKANVRLSTARLVTAISADRPLVAVRLHDYAAAVIATDGTPNP